MYIWIVSGPSVEGLTTQIWVATHYLQDPWLECWPMPSAASVDKTLDLKQFW